MTDIHLTIPSFSTAPYSNILPSLERASISCTDLLTLDALDIAKQAQVPAKQVRRLVDALGHALQSELDEEARSGLESSGKQIGEGWTCVSLLDDGLDRLLGGGLPTGYITEMTGESGSGKTNLILALLTSVQLPPTHGGLSRNALYISTEAALQTSRLSQILSYHPRLTSPDLPEHQRPSLNRILSIQTPDLESQEHILRYQLPVAVKRHNIGLVAIDSITANFRAEFERRKGGGWSGDETSKFVENVHDLHASGDAMARRTGQLLSTGALLCDLARKEDLVVIVGNQVADRFAGVNNMSSESKQPISTGSRGAPIASSLDPPSSLSETGQDVVQPNEERSPLYGSLTLDHQQRFFTGWGDSMHADGPNANMKTPSLGLVWTNQIDCRIALVKRVRPWGVCRSDGEGGESASRMQRHMKVPFCKWAPSTTGTRGVEFVILKSGVRAANSARDENGSGGEPK